ncbi:unnamed protein product [Closterium sp. Naga37s-1]|nr:unnamed protein product [Closterium sp. Naga37s-1]
MSMFVAKPTCPLLAAHPWHTQVVSCSPPCLLPDRPPLAHASSAGTSPATGALIPLDFTVHPSSTMISHALSHMQPLPIPPPLAPTTGHGRDLRFTGFYGEIPASIGNATGLEHLDLSRVRIEGRLPSTFSRLTALTYLYPLTLPLLPIVLPLLPSSPSLTHALACHRDLYPLAPPHSLGPLTAPPLLHAAQVPWRSSALLAPGLDTSLAFESTQRQLLHAPPPLRSLGDPVYLWHEDYTWLNEFLQDDYTDIHSITATMKAHVLQGPMADLSCLAPLTRLQHLALRNLNLTPGPLPPALSALTLLTHLDIQFLPATSLPTWITALSSLEYLDVTGNFHVHRSTPFPTEWTALTGLGSLPTALPTSQQCALPSPCTSRRAGLNGFTGSIPSTISALTALYDLELYYNNISGTIPAAMANLTLSSLSLFSNMLSGTIPALDSMSLSSLDLSYNHLSGSLPTALCSIADSLKLGHNDLEGPMPACFDRVRGHTDLSFNNLSGPIPVTLSRHALDNLHVLHFSLLPAPVSILPSPPFAPRDLTSSGLTCPLDGSELSAPTTPPSASQAASQPSLTASPPSPPTTAAIRSMPHAATIGLVLVVAAAAVLMVLTLGNIRTPKGFSAVPPSQTDIEL